MPIIDIPNNTTVKLVDEKDADEDYQYRVPVGQNPITVGHGTSRDALEGRQIDPGDRGEFRNLNGKPLYARATQGASQIDIFEASVLVTFFNRNTFQGGVIGIEGADGLAIEDENLNSLVADSEVGLVTYLSRALNDVALDELVTRVTDSTGTQVDPLDEADRGTVTAQDSGTGSANAAELTGQTHRDVMTVTYSTSGDATLTVEVDHGNGNGYQQFDSVSVTGATTDSLFSSDVAAPDVRAYLDQNRNNVDISMKGV